MLMGEYEHTLDEKGRVTVPSRLRDDLHGHFVITKGLDGCLFIYPAEEWGKMEEHLKSLPMTNANARAFARLFLAGAQEAEFDKQYRVLIPSRLREHAGIERDVVLVGVSTRVEMWSKERWERYQTEAQTSYEEIAEKMVDFGF